MQFHNDLFGIGETPIEGISQRNSSAGRKSLGGSEATRQTLRVLQVQTAIGLIWTFVREGPFKIRGR